MPVQINELIIRANVVEEGSKSKPGAGTATASPNTASNSSGNIDKAEIIQECVDMVMELLNNKKER